MNLVIHDLHSFLHLSTPFSKYILIFNPMVLSILLISTSQVSFKHAYVIIVKLKIISHIIKELEKCSRCLRFKRLLIILNFQSGLYLNKLLIKVVPTPKQPKLSLRLLVALHKLTAKPYC